MDAQEVIAILKQMRDVKRDIIGMQATGDSIIDAHLELQVMNSKGNSEEAFQKKIKSYDPDQEKLKFFSDIDSDPNVRKYYELTRKLERDYLPRMSAEDLMHLYKSLVP